MTPDQKRKILEAAAKACGIKGQYGEFQGIHERDSLGEAISMWNPLDSSADCAAMCAKLEIDTRWFYNGVECGDFEEDPSPVLFKDHDNSRMKAWMYAATMVAAKIGDLK